MMRPLRCRPQTAVVLLACWSLVTSHWSLPGASAEVMDSVVAVVNDDVITQRELERALVAADRPELDVADLTPDHPVWRRAVEQLVEERLIIQAAKRAGLAPDEAAVEGRLQQMQANFRSVEEFHAALADEGLTTEELKVRYTEQWLMQRIVEREVRAKLRVTPTEVAREYEAHRDTYVQPAAWLVRMIVIKPQQGEAADAARRRLPTISCGWSRWRSSTAWKT